MEGAAVRLAWEVLAVSFAGTLKETDTPRDFFRFLVREGIRVKVTANDTSP